MKWIFIPLFLICFVPLREAAAQQAESAGQVLQKAYKKAAESNKNVFVIHASWCGWCHKPDSSMNDPACNTYFHSSYDICHLTVYGSAGKKMNGNPGAEDLLKKYGGEQQASLFYNFRQSGEAAGKFKKNGSQYWLPCFAGRSAIFYRDPRKDLEA